MIKIICDVCKQEIEGECREIKACSVSVHPVEERLDRESPQYFLTLKQVHLECAEEVEEVIKEAMKEYLSNFSAGGKS